MHLRPANLPSKHNCSSSASGSWTRYWSLLRAHGTVRRNLKKTLCKTRWKWRLNVVSGAPGTTFALQTWVNICRFLTASMSSKPGTLSTFTARKPSGGAGSINRDITSTSSLSSTLKKKKHDRLKRLTKLATNSENTKNSEKNSNIYNLRQPISKISNHRKSTTTGTLRDFRSLPDLRMYYQWQKYCSLSCVSNLSNLKTEWDTTKKHSIRSIDRANFYRINTVLICCTSFRSQVMKVWKKKEEAIPLPLITVMSISDGPNKI